MVHTFKHLFTPHHTNNHRPRVLHPSGLASLIVIFVVFNVILQGFKYSLASLPTGLILGYASSILPEQVVTGTNNERTKQELTPLATNQILTEAAAAKANHMFANNYWAHIAPDGTTPWVFIKNAGYTYSVAGENLARDFGDTDSMVKAWMDSPTHKENIMNPKYTEIGVAVVDGVLQGEETTLVVQMFGSPQNRQPKTTEVAAKSGKPLSVKTPLPTLTPVPQILTPAPLAALSVAGPSKTIIFSPLSIIKVVGAAILIILGLVLLYDEYSSRKRHLSRRVGKNWAHLALFAIALLLLSFITSGRVPAKPAGQNAIQEENYVNRP
jgi:hypothetical protein